MPEPASPSRPSARAVLAQEWVDAAMEEQREGERRRASAEDLGDELGSHAVELGEAKAGRRRRGEGRNGLGWEESAKTPPRLGGGGGGAVAVTPNGSLIASLSHPSCLHPLLLHLSAPPPHALRL
uniref:Uncharacterized protein n=1 Tax=Oryza sativa subsp. japonica TaxID=39947 RepID=Q6ZKR1_ORYSJ|nr:hypothetical protein [Oryza sativa Japonica Group]